MPDERRSRRWPLCAESDRAVSRPKFKEVFPPPSRVMDHLPNAKTKKWASVKKRNASFYLPLSFCAPCSLSSTPFPNISYLSSSQYPILRPENNAFVLLPPPHPSIPPSICVARSVTSRPCQATRERGRDRPRHCPPGQNPRNINSVSLEQQRRALASNLSDLMMSGPLFFGPFI